MKSDNVEAPSISALSPVSRPIFAFKLTTQLIGSETEEVLATHNGTTMKTRASWGWKLEVDGKRQETAQSGVFRTINRTKITTASQSNMEKCNKDEIRASKTR